MNGTLYTWDGETQISKVSNIWFESPTVGVVKDPDYEKRKILLHQTQGFPCLFDSHERLSPNDTEKKLLKIEDGEFINMWLRIEIDHVIGKRVSATARVVRGGKRPDASD